jgi:hypothetical protein
MKEADIGRLIQIEVCRRGGRLFRVPVGLYYTKYGTPVKVGVPGLSDYAGWMPRKITQEMVGKTIAQYLAIESKTPHGKTEKKRLEKQLNFIDIVNQSGGLAFVAHSAEEAINKLKYE